MEKTETLTFSENEILYLLIIAGADDEDIFERFYAERNDQSTVKMDAYYFGEYK